MPLFAFFGKNGKIMNMKQNKLFSAERRAERQKFYWSTTWRRLRKIQLRKHALCEICLEDGLQTVANTCDHIDPTWETWEEFIKGPFQSLCETCHNEKSKEDLSKLIKKDRLKLEVYE